MIAGEVLQRDLPLTVQGDGALVVVRVRQLDRPPDRRAEQEVPRADVCGAQQQGHHHRRIVAREELLVVHLHHVRPVDLDALHRVGDVPGHERPARDLGLDTAQPDLPAPVAGRGGPVVTAELDPPHPLAADRPLRRVHERVAHQVAGPERRLDAQVPAHRDAGERGAVVLLVVTWAPPADEAQVAVRLSDRGVDEGEPVRATGERQRDAHQPLLVCGVRPPVEHEPCAGYRGDGHDLHHCWCAGGLRERSRAEPARHEQSGNGQHPGTEAHRCRPS